MIHFENTEHADVTLSHFVFAQKPNFGQRSFHQLKVYSLSISN